MIKLNEKYSPEQFQNFLRDFLPADFLEKEEDIIINENRYKVIKNAKILGTCESLEMQILEMDHEREGDPRVTITNDAFKILADHWIHRALVIFKNKDTDNYRFSYLTITLDLNDKNQAVKKYSNAKRYSFYLGPDAKTKTAESFLIGKGRIESIDDLLDRFNVEIVTKEFYQNYKKLFEKLLEYLKNDKNFNSFAIKHGLKLEIFTKKLLGQIVFIYFLQKKGWLGAKKGEYISKGDKRFLRNLFEKNQQEQKSFFNDCLEYLFYDCLNKLPERAGSFYRERFDCQIPFLNGGLFEPINEYDWEEKFINIPNEVFSDKNGDGILDIFDIYNFTIDENTPDDQEVSVDPEMLGKVFENLLEDNIRKGQGAFYTPREIVHYMCQESLVNYLDSNLGNGREFAEKYVKFFESKEEIKTITGWEGDVIKIDKLLQNIKVCDPACGSGAFLVGMLNEIIKLRYLLRDLVDMENPRKTIYDLKKETIQNCLYGVDLDPGAVDIAKLRFWLSIVVDENIEDIEPLPNLDYKIMQGNSLVEEFEGIKLFDEMLLESIVYPNDELVVEYRLKESEIQRKILPFYEQNPYLMKNKKTNRPVELTRLESALKEVKNSIKREVGLGLAKNNQSELFLFSQDSKKIREKLEELHKKYFKENDKKEKEKIKKEIEDTNWDLIEASLKEQDNTNAINKVTNFKESNSKPFFLWKLHFAEVFRTGGFDIIIANPPYIDSETMIRTGQTALRETLTRKYESAVGNWDLFVVFIEKGELLIKDKGILSYIVPNKLISQEYAVNIREKMNQNSLIEIRDYSRIPVFINADIYPITFVMKKDKKDSFDVKITKMKNVTCIDYSNYINKKDITNENWDIYFTRSDVLKIVQKTSNNENKFSDLGSFESPSTVSEAYEIKKFLKDDEYRDDFKKFINSGTIDQYVSLWGEKSTTYIKNKYKKPVISRNKLLEINNRRNNQYDKSKIIIANMTGNLEAFLDTKGEYLAGKSTTIFLGHSQNLKVMLALLNSALISFLYKIKYHSGKMSGGALSISPKKIGSIRVPEISNEVKINLIDKVDHILKSINSINYCNDVEQQKKVEKYREEIDKIVYSLYGLKEEEIEIIEKEK